MLPREFAPAKQRERASWRCELPRATPNSSKLARTGLSMTAPNSFWIPRRLAKSFCSSAVEQNSPRPPDSYLQEIAGEPIPGDSYQFTYNRRVKKKGILAAVHATPFVSRASQGHKSIHGDTHANRSAADHARASAGADIGACTAKDHSHRPARRRHAEVQFAR